MSTATNNTVNPLPVPTSNPEGQLISVSCNVVMALSLLEQYMDSTYQLQAADTQLQATISNQETAIVDKFESTENAPGSYIIIDGHKYMQGGGLLWQMEHLTPYDDRNGEDDYSSDLANLTTEYSAASAQNQAKTKVMDANNSVAQNTLSQNSQGQQGVTTTMSSINSVAGNLVRITQA